VIINLAPSADQRGAGEKRRVAEVRARRAPPERRANLRAACETKAKLTLPPSKKGGG